MEERAVKRLVAGDELVSGGEFRFHQPEEGAKLTLYNSNGFGYAEWTTYQLTEGEWIEIERGSRGDPTRKEKFLGRMASRPASGC